MTGRGKERGTGTGMGKKRGTGTGTGKERGTWTGTGNEIGKGTGTGKKRGTGTGTGEKDEQGRELKKREGMGQERGKREGQEWKKRDEHPWRAEKRYEEVFYDTIPLTHGRLASNKFFPDKVFATRIGKKEIKCIFFSSRGGRVILSRTTFSINIVLHVPSVQCIRHIETDNILYSAGVEEGL